MFGLVEDEMLGKNVLMPLPFRQEHDQYISRYLRTGKVTIIGIGRQVMARRKDGSIFPVELAVSEILHLRLFSEIIHDISQRKQLDRHLTDARVQKLHDGIGGLMTGISMLAKTLQFQLQSAARREADQVGELVDHIRDVHEQLRGISRGLLPVEISPG